MKILICNNDNMNEEIMKTENDISSIMINKWLCNNEIMASILIMKIVKKRNRKWK
jgi:hypothetical protein